MTSSTLYTGLYVEKLLKQLLESQVYDPMRFSLPLLACILLSVLGSPLPGQTNDGPPAAQRAEIARRHGLDLTSSLESRVRETPASVLKLFEEGGRTAPTPHTLTAEEQRKLATAFASLPPLHRRILTEHLRGVSFVDGMPNTALTSTVNPDEPYKLCHITIRAAILRQTASEWLTEKERTCFNTTGSSRSVSVEAGKREALDYVLLHEATHVVDFCLGLSPPAPSPKLPAGGEPNTAFTREVWSERITPAPPYRDPLRARVRFYAFGEALPIDQAQAVYTSLRRTPFVSLYGGTNWFDDLAEYVTVYHWTEVFKQPFQIVIREEGKEVFAYAPMKSDLVRSRISQMKPFYVKDQERPEGPALDRFDPFSG